MLAFRPPPDYGSGGQPGVVAGAAHWGPVPVGHRCRVVDGPAAGCPAWPLPQCPRALRRSRVSAVPGASWLPVSGRPPPVSARPDSRYQPAASTWPVWPAQTGKRNVRGAAVVPQRRLWIRRSRLGSRTPRPLSRELSNRTRRTLWLSAAASGTAVGVRTVGVHRGHLPQPAGVNRYRKRSSCPRPLDGCRHRR